METEVTVKNQQPVPLDQTRLIEVIKKSLRIEHFDKSAEVSIVLVDDSEIHDLNKQYRGIDRATDVLSFAQLEGESLEVDGMPVVLGDIVISVDTATRQAEARGRTLESEVELLSVHGLLHLLGYNDETDEESAEMRKRETEILGEPVYM